jgi:glutamate/tyrosine decarboxylase-like PLP-dependent enzyme
VMGGSLPVGVAADWLVSAWGQPTGTANSSFPAAIEEVCRRWLLDLLDLPREASIGFVTGATMANFTCLAAARTELLQQAGWDVEANGLFDAPSLDVFIGDEAHVAVLSALQYLGLGRERVHRIPVDNQGRMLSGALADAVARSTSRKIIIAQAGHINSGALTSLTLQL